MATTTPNFGWSVPTSSDLVKNGAVAIETLGDSIDASLVDLKGGTTDQVLAKNSNTDMDFKWVSDATGMTNPMTTTGDVIYSSSGSTPDRLGIGTSGQVLTVAGGLPSWATPSSGSAMTLITTLSPSAVSEVTADNIFTSTYENYVIQIAVDQTANAVLFAQLRASGSNLTSGYINDTTATTPSTGGTDWALSDNTGGACRVVSNITLYSPQLSVPTMGTNARMATVDNTRIAFGYINPSTSAYDGIRIANSSGNMTGTIRIYGLAN
jgi:hypothetical protein